MPEVTNGGLAPPVFSDGGVCFALTCTKCARPMGTLRADKIDTLTTVLLKTYFLRPPKDTKTAYLTCDECDHG